jgi:hypothetical protein
MMHWLTYVGMPILTYDASAMCQDPNLFLPEADLKDLVVPVCVIGHGIMVGNIAC